MHRGQVVSLLKHIGIPDVEIGDAYLNWKYLNNPFSEVVGLYLVFSGDQLVAMRGAYGVRWQRSIESRDLPMASVGDLIIDPDHRGQGLFSKLMAFMVGDLAARGVEYIVNLSPGTLTQLSAIASGWRSLGAVEEWTLLTMRYRLLRKFNHILKIEPQKPFDRLQKYLGNESRSENLSLVLEKQPRPHQMETLVEALEKDGRIHQDKSEAYFTWRFCNPLSEFRFIYAGDLDGYLVLQAHRFRETHSVQIVDWEAKEFYVLEKMLKYAVRLCAWLPLSLAPTCIGQKESELLSHCGFKRKQFGVRVSDYRPMILVRPTVDRREEKTREFDINDASNWNLRPIYSDNY